MVAQSRCTRCSALNLAQCHSTAHTPNGQAVAPSSPAHTCGAFFLATGGDATALPASSVLASMGRLKAGGACWSSASSRPSSWQMPRRRAKSLSPWSRLVPALRQCAQELA